MGALVLGGAVALTWQAPARWLADAVAQHAGQRLLLADTRGTLWQGSAELVLTAGPGSRDARRLPGRLHWHWGWIEGAAALQLRLDCCSPQPLTVRLRPGWQGWTLSLPAGPMPWAQLPAGWLAGLGTPFNTLQPQGLLSVGSEQGLQARPGPQGWTVDGGLQLRLTGLSTRLATVAPLGDYELRLEAPGTLSLRSRDGAALRVQAEGRWQPRLQVQGHAEAAPGHEAALDNLLNIVGRRDGARTLITLG
jgi:general secretion pathway protein N